MRTVLFVAPFPMKTTLAFATAVGALKNVRLIGIFQSPPANESSVFDHVMLVQNVFDLSELIKKVHTIRQAFGGIHRVLGVLEDLQVTLARVREHFDIPGMLPGVALNFRDKARMKTVLRGAGIPTARHASVNTVAEARAFAAEVGFPLVLKPPAGAGCRSTHRANDAQELVMGMRQISTRPVLIEEFLTGVEHSMETFTLGGVPRFYSFSRYYPTPLEVMENPWIQWVVLFPRVISSPIFTRARIQGFAAIQALGLGTGMTHMEWFERPDGSVAIGEIGARPPGAQIAPVTGRIHGFDAYEAWAELMVNHRFVGQQTRNTACAIVYLRGTGKGPIRQVTGLAEAQKKMGEWVVDVRLPKVGMPRSSSYEGDGYVVIEHPETEMVKQAAMTLLTTVKVI